MPAKEDVEFLALLVSRGKLPRDRAELLFVELQAGERLDGLLIRELELSPAEVARLRRTRAGEIPEIPGYEVIEKIGSGGTSDVFRVLDQKSGRVIAMKVLREGPAATPGVMDAFRREAKLLKALEHPGLVKGLGWRATATSTCR
jgi:serine/threonine protein kinase